VETAQITGTIIYHVNPDNVLISLLNSPSEKQKIVADELPQEIPPETNTGNVNITNNNTTTINGDVYINKPSWF
jgi:hypothetical protein